MSLEYQDSAFHAFQILRGAEVLHGVTVSEILARAGAPEALLDQPLHPLPLPLGSRLVACAVEMTRDPLLGLRWGVEMYLRRMGLAGLAVTHAPNLRTAFEGGLKILRHTSNIFTGSLDTQDDLMVPRIRRRIDRCLYTDQVMDLVVGFSATLSYRYADRRSWPRAAEIPAERVAQAGRDVYERLLGCPVVPTTDNIGVRHYAESMSLAMPNDGDIHQVLAPIVERKLNALPAIDSLSDIVSTTLRRSLEHYGICLSLEALAHTLGTSPRTLQERLRAERTSLRRLLDQVRRDLATHWIEQGLAREKVSLRLGFSESSAFRRAWRRWQAQ